MVPLPVGQTRELPVRVWGAMQGGKVITVMKWTIARSFEIRK